MSLSETLTGEEAPYELDEEEKKKQEVLTKRTRRLANKKGQLVTLEDAAQRFNARLTINDPGWLDFKANDEAQADCSLQGTFGLAEDCVYERPREEQSDGESDEADAYDKVEKIIRHAVRASKLTLKDILHPKGALLSKRDLKVQDILTEKAPAYIAFDEWRQTKKREDNMGLRIKRFLADGATKQLALNMSDHQVNAMTRKLLQEEVTHRFGLNKMNQEFQAALMRDQRKIFNELTADERAAAEREKSMERTRQLEQMRLQKRKQFNERLKREAKEK